MRASIVRIQRRPFPGAWQVAGVCGGEVRCKTKSILYGLRFSELEYLVSPLALNRNIPGNGTLYYIVHGTTVVPLSSKPSEGERRRVMWLVMNTPPKCVMSNTHNTAHNKTQALFTQNTSFAHTTRSSPLRSPRRPHSLLQQRW